MRRILLSFISVILIISVVLPVFPFAANDFTFSENKNGTLTLIKADGSLSGDITVPGEKGGKKIVAIGEDAFAECINVTSVTVPNSVVSIKNHALGYIKLTDGNSSKYVKLNGFTLCGNTNTVCEVYASENGLAFKTFLSAPVLSGTSVCKKGILITWNKVENANKYRVFVKNGNSWTKLGDTEKTQFTAQKLTSGKSYTFTVRAYYLKQSSSYSKKGITQYYLAPPVISSFENTENGIKLIWDKVTGAECYRIYKSVNGEWSVLDTVKTTSVTDTTAESGKTEKYCLRAYNKTKGVWSVVGAEKSALYLAAPKISVKNTANGIQVSWNKINGASKINLYKRVPGKWELIKEAATETSYLDKSVQSNKECTYFARAFKGKERSTNSNIVTQLFLAVPGSVKSESTSSGIKVSWKAVAGADGYYLYRRGKNDTSFERLGVVKGTSYTDNSVKDGFVYIYTLKAKHESFVSYQNKAGTECKYVAPPVLTASDSTNNSVKLSWSKISDVSSYRIYRKTPGKSFSLLASTTKNSYTDKTAKPGNTYAYCIKAVLTDKTVSGTSNGVNIRIFDRKRPMVALTYDDGPYSPNTNRILDALEKVNGKATFFVVGNRVNEYASSVKRAAKMGCEIGNHTYTHSILTEDSPSQIKSELNKCNNAVKNITGTAPVIMRPPGGSYNGTVKENCPLPMIIWSIDTRDWETQDAASTVSKIKNYVEDGDIILMHDLYSATAAASEEIIPWLVSQGYQLVTVSELMQAKGIDMKPGTPYCDAIN